MLTKVRSRLTESPHQGPQSMKAPGILLLTLLPGFAAGTTLGQAPASDEPTRVEVSGTIGKVTRGLIEVSADSIRDVGEGAKKPKTKAKGAATKTAPSDKQVEKQTVLVAVQASTMVRIS